eukprot:4158681-Pyramimonas_sp.AAC.2
MPLCPLEVDDVLLVDGSDEGDKEAAEEAEGATADKAAATGGADGGAGPIKKDGSYTKGLGVA